MPKTLPISFVVIEYNEVKVIGRCLDSVPFAAEKIVVDSGSTDGTPETAQEHGARVVKQSWLGFGPLRNFASGLATCDWILALDADEHLRFPSFKSYASGKKDALRAEPRSVGGER